jgi:hypothetical protein
MNESIKLWNWGKVEGIASAYGDVNTELLINLKITAARLA